MTFGNSMVIREVIVDIDDESRRVVWSATGGHLTHHNASAQVLENDDGSTRVVWITDLLPDDAAESIGSMMEQGLTVMKATLDRLSVKA